MKVAIASIQRNRNPYIAEWIAFHLAMGFNQFYIYCHKTTDGMTETLARLAQHFPITVIPTTNDDHPQLVAYQHAWTNYGSSVDWMAFIDGMNSCSRRRNPPSRKRWRSSSNSLYPHWACTGNAMAAMAMSMNLPAC